MLKGKEKQVPFKLAALQQLCPKINPNTNNVYYFGE